MKKTPSTPLPRFDRLLQRAVLDLEMHREDEALLKLREAVGLQPANADAWFWLGRCKEELQDRPGAGYCYTFALSCAQRHSLAREALKRLGYLGHDDDKDDLQGAHHEH